MKYKIILLNLLILFLFGCTNKEVETVTTPDIKINVIKTDIEYNEKINLSDLITLPDNYKYADFKIDTLRLGTKEIKFNYTDEEEKNHTFKFEINIKDTTKPMILHRTAFTYEKGSDINLLDKIICGDNYDDYIICNIKGEYDINKVVTYKLYFTAEDSSGNLTESPFNLVIKDKIEPSKLYTPKTITLSEFNNKYINNTTNELAIDVSTWQGDIDYDTLAESGIKNILIRIGFSTTDNRIIMDNRFERNLKLAHEHGLNVGLYFYSKAHDLEQSIKEADWIIDNLNNEKLELPIYFDWECWDDFNSFHISYVKLNLIAENFMNRLIQKGYSSGLYGSASYLEKIWDLNEYNIWLAHYTEKTDYQNKYNIWQQTASGIVPGIEGNVDLNIIKK